MSLTWVNSNGGPLVLVPTAHLSRTRGVIGSSPGSVKNDYERACDVKGDKIEEVEGRHGMRTLLHSLPPVTFGSRPGIYSSDISLRQHQAPDQEFVLCKKS